MRGLFCYVQAVGITSVIDHSASCVPTILLRGHFRVPPGLCFKTNTTHFHKKGCAPSLILKVGVFGLGSGLLK